MARQNFVGMVISHGKMSKTVRVRVQQPTFDNVINKHLLKRKDYLVHDEGDVCKTGDIVRIEATRPLSARKFFAVSEIIKNSGQQLAQFQEAARKKVAQEELEKSQQFLERRSKLEAPQEHSSIIDDMLFIDTVATTPEGQVSPEDLSKANELKAKHKISTWPPENQLIKLAIQTYKESLEKIPLEIAQIEKNKKEIDEILADEEKLTQVLKACGKEPDQVTKRNIRRNIVAKYVKSKNA